MSENGAASPPYDFDRGVFDLDDPGDRKIIGFILSQALYGEATGVYCGRSLYSAGSLEAAKFYVRQARQELAHLELFADIFRILELEPTGAHWVLKLLATHNDYYPLKVFMEHAVGEGMVLDIFKDLLLQTLPDSDPRVHGIKKKLQAVCRDEGEHVAWGEKETQRILEERPWLRLPFYGLLELQMALIPLLARALPPTARQHPVLKHSEGFIAHVRNHVLAQGRRLGYVPPTRPGAVTRSLAMIAGLALYARSRLARSRSRLDKTYLRELGFSR